MYPDDELGECHTCDIKNCQVCSTGIKCEKCVTNSVPITTDEYNTVCMMCDDTAGMSGWIGLANCKTCELSDKGSGAVNCLDPDYYKKSIGAGGISAIVISILLVVAVVCFLVWWFVCKKGGRSSRKRGGGSYASLMKGESCEFRQSLL